MVQETHYIDIRIGVDFKEVFKPELVSGIKFMLGVEDDEDLVTSYSAHIVDDIIRKTIEKRSGYVEVVSADVRANEGGSESYDLPEEEILEETIEEVLDKPKMVNPPTSWTPTPEFDSIDVDDVIQQSERLEDLDSEDTSNSTDEEYDMFDLLDAITEATFEAESKMGEITGIYVKNIEEYEMLKVNFPRMKDLMFDMSEYPFEETYKNEDVIVNYNDINENIKQIKKTIGKEGE